MEKSAWRLSMPSPIHQNGLAEWHRCWHPHLEAVIVRWSNLWKPLLRDWHTKGIKRMGWSSFGGREICQSSSRFDRFRYIPPKMPSEVLRWGLGNEGAQHLKLARYVLNRFPPSRRPVHEVIRLFQNDLRTHVQTPWFAWLHLLRLQMWTWSACVYWIVRWKMMRSVSDQTIIVLTASFQYSSGETFNRLPVPLLIWVPNSVRRLFTTMYC